MNQNTASTYDLGDRLTSITPPAASATSFTFDALGHSLPRVTPAGSDTYEYFGTTEMAWRITSAGIPTTSALWVAGPAWVATALGSAARRSGTLGGGPLVDP